MKQKQKRAIAFLSLTMEKSNGSFIYFLYLTF